MPVNRKTNNVLKLYRSATLFLNKVAKFEDIDVPYYDSPEDDEPRDFKNLDNDEKFNYFMGGEHPSIEIDRMQREDPELHPEDFEIKEPVYRFDPKEHLEGGGSIIGKDDSPYIEDDEGKHYDIFPQDREILDDDEREPDTLDELQDDITDFDLTPEDAEYIRNLKIKTNEE